MARPAQGASSSRPRLPPVTTPEAREQQLVALAMDVAEEQMRNGTASSQVITHWLKTGSSHHALEKQKLKADLAMAEAKIQQMGSSNRTEQLMTDALKAFRQYSGQEEINDED